MIRRATIRNRALGAPRDPGVAPAWPSRAIRATHIAGAVIVAWREIS